MRTRTAAGTALAVLAALMVGGVPAYLKRRFRPPASPPGTSPDRLGLLARDIWLTSRSGTRLHGWYIPAGGPGPAVLVLHGWGANSSLMMPFAPPIHAAGYHLFFLDARNHGLSEPADYSSMLRFAEDLETGLDWLGTRAEVTRIGVVGHSVGSGAALLAASERDDIAALVLFSAFADPRRIMREQTSLKDLPAPVSRIVFWYTSFIIRRRIDDIVPRNRIGRVRAPILLVHGARDEVVPLGDAVELLFAASAARLLVLPAADHSDPATFEHCLPHVVEFLDTHLGGPPPGDGLQSRTEAVSGRETVDALVGTWTLVSAASTRSGTISEPYGDHPHGVLVYGADGRVATIITHGDARRFTRDSIADASQGEAAAAFRRSLAYFGRYTVDGQAGTVTHHIEGSVFPNWVGESQLRYVEVDGDRLTLRTPPLPTGGGDAVFTLVWQRAG